jgi:aryl-phospho-beta-D-glucosidase BglC (GH1 family)
MFGGFLAAPAPSASAAPAASCATTATAPAQKAKLAVGTQFHGTWAELSDDDRICILNRMADAGATWVRLDLGWTMIQPTARGEYHMAWGVPMIDKVVNMAHSRGLKVLATFWQTPQWASGSTNKRVLPRDVNDYAAAIKWAAARWKTQVQAWEIWNEPNAAEFLSPPDPTAYTRLLKAAYPAVKAGNPNAKVVFGGPMFVDTDWISKAYTAGAKGSYDIMAVHPYMGNASYGPEAIDRGRERMTHTQVLVDLMKAKGESTKPIWFTEFGWSTHANTATTPVWFHGVSEAVQADYLKRTFAMVQNRYPQVTNLFWYTSRDLVTGSIHPDNRGLLRRDFSAKPALGAMKCYTRAIGC